MVSWIFLLDTYYINGFIFKQMHFSLPYASLNTGTDMVIHLRVVFLTTLVAIQFLRMLPLK